MSNVSATNGAITQTLPTGTQLPQSAEADPEAVEAFEQALNEPSEEQAAAEEKPWWAEFEQATDEEIKRLSAGEEQMLRERYPDDDRMYRIEAKALLTMQERSFEFVFRRAMKKAFQVGLNGRRG